MTKKLKNSAHHPCAKPIRNSNAPPRPPTPVYDPQPCQTGDHPRESRDSRDSPAQALDVVKATGAMEKAMKGWVPPTPSGGQQRSRKKLHDTHQVAKRSTSLDTADSQPRVTFQLKLGNSPGPGVARRGHHESGQLARWGERKVGDGMRTWHTLPSPMRGDLGARKLPFGGAKAEFYSFLREERGTVKVPLRRFNCCKLPLSDFDLPLQSAAACHTAAVSHRRLPQPDFTVHHNIFTPPKTLPDGLGMKNSRITNSLEVLEYSSGSYEAPFKTTEDWRQSEPLQGRPRTTQNQNIFLE
ncbi:hypothetical protein C8R46DRAFT_1043443 [Mycena filopes]|nr:hypothetical protein C8R46DRAFT_1043443 [Mycena filopes]